MIDIEDKMVQIDCPRHGPVDCKVWKLTSSPDFTPARCSACETDAKEQKAAADAERARFDRENHRKATVKRHLAESMVPVRFSESDFSSYKPSCDKGVSALEICSDYARSFQPNSPGLILCGNAGTGKTHLACSIVNHVIVNHGRSARFMKTAQAVRVVKQTYSRDSSRTEQEAINSFKAFDLLVLDEVGVQFGSDAEKNILFEIINERYEAMLPTILISNLALPALQSFVGERVIDRMKEGRGRVIVFDWASHRGAA